MLTQIRVESGEQPSEKLHIPGGPASKHVVQYPAPLGARAFQHIPTRAFQKAHAAAFIVQVHTLRSAHQQRELFFYLLERTTHDLTSGN
jgi:hypothetical protein